LVRHQLKEGNLVLIKNYEENLRMIISGSSIIWQFSFEFILRRFDGDAASTIFDTEPVRLAVVTGI
jgi:hypothetical protein